MKITKSVWETLPAGPVKDAFKPSADNPEEYDNGEENAAGLKSALDKEKAELATVKGKLNKFEADKAAEIEAARKKAVEEAREKGDFKAVEDDYKRRISELEKAQKQAVLDAENRTKAEALDKAAEEASKIFVAPKAMTPFVKQRLSVDLVDGKAIVRVKDKDGNASGMSLEDLRNEYLTDPDLKASIAASKGSGGGSGLPTPGGGSGGVPTDDKFDAANADPKSMIARLEAKGLSVDGDDD